MKEAEISILKIKKNILFFAALNFAVYVILFLGFKYFNLLNITGLRMVNYITLTLISLYQIHAITKSKNGYIPFLKSYIITFVTGTLSFMFFSIYIFIYSWLDPLLYELFIMDANGESKIISAMLIFFEGSGGTIIISLIAMFYSGRYQDNEASI